MTKIEARRIATAAGRVDWGCGDCDVTLVIRAGRIIAIKRLEQEQVEVELKNISN